jgi:hypothetical protein
LFKSFLQFSIPLSHQLLKNHEKLLQSMNSAAASRTMSQHKNMVFLIAPICHVRVRVLLAREKPSRTL